MIDDPSVPMGYDPPSPMGGEQITPDDDGGAESEATSSSDAQGTPGRGSEVDPAATPPSDSQDRPSREPAPEEGAALPDDAPGEPSREPDPEPEVVPLTDDQDTASSEPEPSEEVALLTDDQGTASSEPEPAEEMTPLNDAQDGPSIQPDRELDSTPSTAAQDAQSREPDPEPVEVPSTEVPTAPSGESDADLEVAPESDTEAEVSIAPGAEVKAKSVGVAQGAAESVPGAEPAVMPLMEHLIELRKRLTWAVLALLISTGISFIFAKQVLILLIAPMGDAMPQALKPTESLGNYMKVALICGVALAMPVIVYQIGRFLAPGLTKQEKRWLFLLVPGATLCFLLGASFAYFVMLPTAIPFLQGFMSDIIEEGWAIGEYLSFVTSLLFWIGLAFELPLFVFFLAKLGIVNAEMLSKNRKYAYLGIAVVAAVITPTVDPLNMLLVMAPLVVLYELGILLAKIA